MGAMLHEQQHYKCLGVKPTARPEEIRQAYKRLARSYHPDRAGADGEEEFKRVAIAYEVLSDPSKRDAYDAARAQRPTGCDLPVLEPNNHPRQPHKVACVDGRVRLFDACGAGELSRGVVVQIEGSVGHVVGSFDDQLWWIPLRTGLACLGSELQAGRPVRRCRVVRLETCAQEGTGDGAAGPASGREARLPRRRTDLARRAATLKRVGRRWDAADQSAAEEAQKRSQTPTPPTSSASHSREEPPQCGHTPVAPSLAPQGARTDPSVFVPTVNLSFLGSTARSLPAARSGSGNALRSVRGSMRSSGGGLTPRRRGSASAALPQRTPPESARRMPAGRWCNGWDSASNSSLGPSLEYSLGAPDTRRSAPPPPHLARHGWASPSGVKPVAAAASPPTVQRRSTPVPRRAEASSRPASNLRGSRNSRRPQSRASSRSRRSFSGSVSSRRVAPEPMLFGASITRFR